MKQINDVRVFFKKSTYHITQRYTCSVLLIYDIIYDMIRVVSYHINKNDIFKKINTHLFV